MKIADELKLVSTIFIDTAPIIYYIESHQKYGPLTREIVTTFQSGELDAFSSVITLTEVLPKPINKGNKKLALKFSNFLKHGKNFKLLDISSGIAERAGKLRGKYTSIRTIDAIQVSTAIDGGADLFITNDIRLKQIKEIRVIVLKNYLNE